MNIQSGYIYAILQDGEIKYIGQTIKNLEERFFEHVNLAKRGKGFYLHKAMRKYGISHFSYKLIEEVSREKLNEREQAWIEFYNTVNIGYNLTKGGEQCSEILKKPCYQFTLEGDFIKEFESVSAAARAVGGSHSNIIKVLSGELYQAYGYRWRYSLTPKLEKLKSNYTGISKAVLQFDSSGNLIRRYGSTKEAGRVLNKSQGNISSAANGKRKTAYGFIWKFEKDCSNDEFYMKYLAEKG